MTATWAEFAAKAFEPKDIFGDLGYEPTPKQREFHAATEFDVLFGGAAGGGKSRALTAHAIRECMQYPGLRVGAFRRTYGELKESLIAELVNLNFAKDLGARWNGTEYELRFPNSSLIMFRYAETVQDATRRQGGQYQLLVFDERTLTRPMCARSWSPACGRAAATSPSSVSAPAPTPAAPVTAPSKPATSSPPTTAARSSPTNAVAPSASFRPSSATTPTSTPSTPKTSRPSRRNCSSFLDGDWDVFAGMMFSEVKRDRHVVEPITLPATWKRYNGVDWGFAAPGQSCGPQSTKTAASGSTGRSTARCRRS